MVKDTPNTTPEATEETPLTPGDVLTEVSDTVSEQLFDLKMSKRQIEAEIQQLQGRLAQTEQGIKVTEAYLAKIQSVL